MNLLEFADGYWSTWRDLVPSAMALLPIQAPHTTHLPWPAMTQLPQNRDYLLHIYDSIGIRSRAAVMADLLTEHARSNGGGSWLSLACGAALSVLQAAVKLPEQVTVDLVDLDPLALEYAAGFAQALGLEPNVTCRQVDLLDVARLPGEVPIRGVGFDVVEMMGFFEYLPDQPRDIDGSMSIPSAGQFLQAALDLAAPGALVVFGNMLTTHPQKDFILKVVQWPYVRPRDLDELARLVSEVGVDPSQVTFYTPDDGVYAVVAIRLPR
jgi:cyclopropane fatty-acyl-phospholipid synthase-like methyltransferase